ncbi:unnamed protein product [Dimorphilus gyrociliatus]|uniref:Uncharacterized protein n=1 Tax=Dimorphilus gyrociliatus TaxID=2664684 RepID=A0A7I8V7D5_9ANNE|nr:unnamed protein product [Dimorphilus gyrociliatus]
MSALFKSHSVDSESSFLRIKVKSATFAQSGSEEDCKSVLSELESLNDLSLTQLYQVVLFTTRMILRKGKNKESIEIRCYKIMQNVFNNIKLSKMEIFEDVFNMLCLYLQPIGNKPGEIINKSEELKMEITTTLMSLIKCSQQELHLSIYSPKFLPALGHAVCILIALAGKELSRGLILCSINALRTITWVDNTDEKILQKLSHLLSSFLPGISNCLLRIAKADNKLGEAIISSSVQLLGDLIALVLSDKYTTFQCDETNELLINRTEEWYQNTSFKIKYCIDAVLKIIAPNQWRVRYSLLCFSEKLLINCRTTLKKCIPALIQIIAISSYDDYEKIKIRARENIDLIKKTFPDIDLLLEENLFEFCKSLLSFVNASNDEKNLSTLKLLRANLELLNSKLESVFLSTSHLNRLLQGLFHLLKFNCSSLSYLEVKNFDIPLTDNELHIYRGRRKYDFVNFTDNAILLEIIQCSKLLGRYSNFQMLSDFLLEFILNSEIHRKEALFILNNAILGSDKNSEDIYIKLLEEYSNAELIDINTSQNFIFPKSDNSWDLLPINKQTSNIVNFQALNNNVIQVCLILEGLANLSEVLKEKFKLHLMTILYLVLEKIGNDNYLVSEEAFHVLQDISKNCSYTSVAHLLSDNMDYLMNSISIKLRHLSTFPNSPSILRVALTYGDERMIEFVDDIMLKILDSLDNCEAEEMNLEFLKVLHAFVGSIIKWKTLDVIETEKEEIKKEEDIDLVDCLLKYHQEQENERKRLEEELNNSDEISSDEEPESNPNLESEDREVTKDIKLVEQVGLRCVHLLSKGNPRVRLLALETCNNVFKCLKNHQNILLPLIHKIWPPYCERFNDKEAPVALRAMQILQTMVAVSKDFTQQRLKTNVIPKIRTFLEKQAQLSRLASINSFKYTNACKYLLNILKSLGKLCKNAQIVGMNLNHLIYCALPYLSCHQPEIVQIAAKELYADFARCDEDQVWLFLHDLLVNNSSDDEYRNCALDIAKILNIYF